MTETVDTPNWDVALANLAREEFEIKGADLTMADFTRLAQEYTIRLDDIMVTLFELVIADKWQYHGEQTISRKILNDLYINGRLHADDLNNFDGGWRPE